MKKQSLSSVIVVFGTGGTIAGTATDATDNLGYTAGQVAVNDLVASVAAIDGVTLEAEQVAQLDSKDMSHALWLVLANRCAHHLARAEVAGLVVTHGTDTLEETAWFLHRTLAPQKPVVLTGAMRPASALQPDGPQNLRDALSVAVAPGARGTMVVFSGRILGALEVRKVHPYRLDAFGSGDAGDLGVVEEGVPRWFRGRLPELAQAAVQLPGDLSAWPQVEIVTSHAGATGRVIRAVCADGARGIVVAATGNGTLHHAVELALLEAQRAGVAVLVSGRCNEGRLLAHASSTWPIAPELTPAKARVELMLRLLERGGTSTAP